MKYKRKDRNDGKGAVKAGKSADVLSGKSVSKLAALMKPITAEQLASCERIGGRIRSFSGPSFEVNR